QAAPFSDELFALLRDRGFSTPSMDPPKYAEIENVDAYCTVDITARLNGAPFRLTSLLGEMEQRGMLIKAFDLNRANSRDPNEIALTVTVARVIKQDDTSR